MMSPHFYKTKDNPLPKTNLSSKEQLYFIFKEQQLVLTDKNAIPTQHHLFVKTNNFIRKLPLGFTADSPIVAELETDLTLSAETQLHDLRSLYPLFSLEDFCRRKGSNKN